MRILGKVEGKRRDDARAWKLPMPVAAPVRTVLQNVGYLQIPSVPVHIHRVSRKETRSINVKIRCDSTDGRGIHEADAEQLRKVRLTLSTIKLII